MKVVDAIKKRRSIRKFASKQVRWNHLCEVLDAARYIPTAGNIPTIKLVVVADPKNKEKLAQFSLNQYFLTEAPYLIVVSSDTERLEQNYGKQAQTYSKQQAGAAIQSMLLRATELKLATCWVGAFNQKAIQRLLKIPNQIEAIIALGHPLRNTQRTPKKQDLNRMAFFETYGKPGGLKHKDIQVRETSLEK